MSHRILLLTTACLASCAGIADPPGAITSTPQPTCGATLTLSTTTIAQGQTLTGTLTYINHGTEPVDIMTAAIAARPPGGTHAGGPYLDLSPEAAATTVPPGGLLTLTASRTIASSDPIGAWDIYPTYATGDGAWHDGDDASVTVTAGDQPTGPATVGQFEEHSLGGMTYAFLKPSNYDPAKSYPVMLFLHQLQNDGAIPQQIEPWFNTVEFRTKHPAFIIAPRCPNSGESSNWGGVSPQSQGCGDQAVQIVRDVMAHYATQTNRIYVTGDSMGGLGSWDMIIRFHDLFAAALPLAGATYDHDLDQSFALLRTTPIWAIHGSGDTQVPLSWDRSMYQRMQAGGGIMKYTELQGYGHDVWDDSYPNDVYMSWLFAQSK